MFVPRCGPMRDHAAISAALVALDDEALLARLALAPPGGAGIGGTHTTLEVEGRTVFVKRVPLTDLERRHPHSTADLFGLPTYYQYGVGAAGFGAWRELAAHQLTTDAVLRGEIDCFPLLYHARVLPEPVRGYADLEAMVAFWHGSPAVRARLEALAVASASVVLFMEYLPRTLRVELREMVRHRDLRRIERVEGQLLAGAAWMRAQGFIHFDAHLDNLLTDGARVVLADFGLATSSAFERTAAEVEFAAAHAGHDRHYLVTQLVNGVLAECAGATRWAERVAAIDRCVAGEDIGVAELAGFVRRHARVARVMNGFYGALHGESRTTPYPRAELGDGP